MKKIKISLILFIATFANAQDFEEYSTLEGVNYGTSFWVEKENSIIQDVVVLGYDLNTDQYGKTFSHQHFGYEATQQLISPLGMAEGDTLDANEDGRMDFIITGIDTHNNTVTNLYTQTSNGLFEETILPMSGVSSGALKVGDLNHDGHADFVITGVDNSSNYIAKLYTGDGLGAFTEMEAPFFANMFGDIEFFDANNDGFTDVLITGFSQSYVPKSMLYINDGTGVFTEHLNSGIADAYFTGLSSGDFNNDGFIDILMTGMNGSYTAYTVIFENDGLGNFVPINNTNFEQLYFGTADFVDYNNDGELDVFITGANMSGSYFSTLYTNSNGVFNEETTLSSVFDNVYVSSAFWADFDNDGDKDVIINGLDQNSTPITKIYRNNTVEICIPNFTNNNGNNEITNVKFREIDHDSPDGMGTPDYENFTSTSSPVHKGENHTITVTGYSLNYPSDVTVYIDFNQNSDLTESNEEFYIGRIPAGNNLNSISAEIFIPANVDLGFIKMRVIKSTNENALLNPQTASIINSPCDQNLLSGQTEDYTLEIKEPPFCPLPTNLTYNMNADNMIEVNWTEPIDLSTFSEYNWKLMAGGDDPMIDNILQGGTVNQGIDFAILNGLPSGTYDFYITTDCGTDLTNSEMLTLNISNLGLEKEKVKILIYPNPTSNNLSIRSEIPITLLEIYTMNGELVHQDIIESNQKQINVSKLSKGSYLIKLSNNRNVITEKLFIN